MVDIHTHILSQTDDGPDSLEISIKMAQNAAELGYKKIVATPHYLPGSYTKTKADNTQTMNNLNKILKERSIDIEVLLGNEVYFDMNILDFLKNGKISTINNSDYLLIETSLFESPLGLETLLFELQTKGYKVIIAHPERNSAWQKDIDYITKLKKDGIYFQLDLGSLEGKYGSKAKEFSKILLKESLIDLVASDSHSHKNYEFIVGSALKKLKNMIGIDAYNSLVNINPTNVINDKDLVKVNTIYKETKKLNFIQRIFKEFAR